MDVPLVCANSVLCARSTPPCDCELYAPEFLVAMLPCLFATAVISAVRKSSWSDCSMECDVLPHSVRKCCGCVSKVEEHPLVGQLCGHDHP